MTISFMLTLLTILVSSYAFYNGLRLARLQKVLEQHTQLINLSADLLESTQTTQESLMQKNSTMGQQMETLSNRITALSHKRESAIMQGNTAGGYKQVISMIHLGASLNETIRDCGLSRAEAELLMSLHGPHAKQAANA